MTNQYLMDYKTYNEKQGEIMQAHIERKARACYTIFLRHAKFEKNFSPTLTITELSRHLHPIFRPDKVN